MKVALAFFGITRSLKYTIHSIDNIFINFFKKHNILYTIFLHTYELSNYSNIRTGEYISSVDNTEYRLLNPDYFEIDNQDTIKENLHLENYRTFPDAWDTNYNSTDNFLLAQYSKSRVTQLITDTNIEFDNILFVRPDCLYVQYLKLSYLESANDKTIVIPNFHLYGKYMFNDRFCITNYKTYKLYGDVFKYMLDISKKEILHSETVLGEIMNSYKLNFIRIPFNFKRIRSNGLCDPKDNNLYEESTIHNRIKIIDYNTNYIFFSKTKCSTQNCVYKIHTNPSNNGGTHCCWSCKNHGNHGPYCERLE